ncbi:bifunctional methylenetetrahydrofolate dehydrogenase/methenyltetrahydrofolate cyclohydrolase FolD [Desulfovibrio litoralis]|uniref:Bifunctional protein FolD n=1 Tax=Desulfovibrio litoralis DSM 11393 TaxID=1121455 RepID=A0A1M7TEG5_9BACT|nr:bifunctional methylenetetrahydrofolate dehydrogenase/methenyltetrahydrofolate cyclohydrolase FolD [Desulfovibrio litoralis]SHN69076.1 methenyltetrahydrofolate cyclohydrolase [Desulfovibrio litoralis DSM 11393]
MILLDGKGTAATLRMGLAVEVQNLSRQIARTPGLAVVLVGNDPASQVYVRAKEKAALEAGLNSMVYRLEIETSQKELEALIDKLNADDNVDGILLQLPLPGHLDSQACLERILPEKDVDGFHPINMGRLALGLPGLRPCTPSGSLRLLAHYGLNPAGKKAVVVGRSNIVGKPLAMMLAAPTINATVTVCHSGTKDLGAECREADFLFLALGKPRFIKKDMIKEGAVVIDIGINRTTSGLCGDCDFEDVKDKVSAITPVPGGIGPMTIAELLFSTIQACKWRNQL